MSVCSQNRKVTSRKDETTVQSTIGSRRSLAGPEVPDGGYGWFVVFASFMAHFFIDGVTYSFGVLAAEFVSHFDASRESVGWLTSVLVSVTFITGPFVSILCDRFGFRAITVAGGVMSATGFAAPFFYSEFWFLYLSASVLTGLGFSFIFLPSIVVVSVYFREKRALAIGMAVCGAGIGTFVFSPLIEHLNETYCWQGSMLIVGGLLLNSVVCGVIYRPLNKRAQIEDHFGSNDSEKKESILPDIETTSVGDNIEMKYKLKTRTSVDAIFTSLTNRYSFTDEYDEKYFCSAPTLPRPPQTKNHFKFSTSPIFLSRHMSVISTNYLLTQPKNPWKLCINDTFNKDLLWNPIFLIFAISNFFSCVGCNAPFLYANDRALEMGISISKATFLISSIGIGNTVGRVIFGYLSTKSFVNVFQLYIWSCIISGLAIIFSSFAVTYPWMIVYTIVFGLSVGTNITLIPIVLVGIFGIDKLNASYGTLMLFEAIGMLIGPPLAGWIFDKTNSFDCSFWVCGAFLAASGFMLYLVYCFKEFRSRKSF